MNVHQVKKKKVSNEDYLCFKELYPLSSCYLCVFVPQPQELKMEKASGVRTTPGCSLSMSMCDGAVAVGIKAAGSKG